MPSSPALSEPPLYVVLNAGSGSDDAVSPAKVIGEVLAASGRTHEVVVVGEGEDLGVATQRAVELASRNTGVVVAAGGDGTLNTVAQAALGKGLAFGVIPQGTFNYFGRAHGIPADTAEATRALLTAHISPVQVGLVNDRIFLVNASLGLYPESLEIREEQTERFGRSQLVAAWAGLLAILRDHHPLRIKLEGPAGARELRTLTLFVGNNRMQLERMGAAADGVEAGRLGAVVLRPASRLRLLWLLVRGAVGRLGQARHVESFTMTALRVAPSNPGLQRVKVATDGEVTWMKPPIEFQVSQRPLLLLKPEANPDSRNAAVE